MRIHDLTGQRFGRLVVKDLAKTRGKDGKIRWVCLCDCGAEKTIRGCDLVMGKTTSCGCLRREATGNRCRTHGGTGSRLYHIWSGIKRRCGNSRWYEHVTYCEEWEEFSAFEKWANKNGYEEHLTIDRIDCEKGYSPDNCRWVTQKQQMNNMRRNLIIEANGESHTAAEWEDLTGIRQATIAYRWRHGYRDDRLFIQPQNQGRSPTKNLGGNINELQPRSNYWQTDKIGGV